MEFASKEKRKNETRGGFPWWMLLAAFALGVLLTLAVTQTQSQPRIVESDSIPQDLLLTATAIIDGVTATANAAEMSAAAEMDAMMATATAIIAQATQQAVQSSP